jgi:hypothetical protein
VVFIGQLLLSTVYGDERLTECAHTTATIQFNSGTPIVIGPHHTLVHGRVSPPTPMAAVCLVLGRAVRGKTRPYSRTTFIGQHRMDDMGTSVNDIILKLGGQEWRGMFCTSSLGQVRFSMFCVALNLADLGAGGRFR